MYTLALLGAGCPADDGTTSSSTGGETSTGSTTDATPTSTGDSSTGTPTTTGDPSSSGDTTEALTSSTSTTDPTTGTSTTDTTDSSTTDGSSTGSSSTTESMPGCGDSSLDMDEACDDGNTVVGDGCTDTCALECSALRFAGKSVAVAADPAPLSVSSVTLAAWYKAPANAPQGVIAAKRGSALGGHFTYNLAVGAAGLSARLQTGLDAQFLDLSAADAVPDGKWHHVAVTYDEATGAGELFLDGVSVASGTKGAGLVAADPTQAFTLGAIVFEGNLNGEATADVADVVVYDTPLTPLDVAGLVDGVYPGGPLAFFPAVEGVGLASVDASGNGHDLTVPDHGWAASGPFCALTCGDDEVVGDEQCDDGNNTLGDGCALECTRECSALHFDGQSIATAADPVPLSVPSVTVGAWYRMAADAPQGVIFGKRGSSLGGHFTYQLSAGPSGLGARLQTGVDAQFLDLIFPGGVPDGAWHHTALRYDATTGAGELFLDGVSVLSGVQGTGLVAADPTQAFTIGAVVFEGNLVSQAVGDIADVVVYDRSLDDAQITGLVEGEYPISPLAFYPALEGAGLVSVDASGNGHDLTVPDGGWTDDGPYCAPFCGDGNLDAGEACDDDNAVTGDGCSQSCAKECSALHFEPDSIAAVAADPAPLAVQEVTLAAWYRASVGAPQGVIASKRGAAAGGHFTYQLGVGPSGLTARLQTGVNAEFLDLAFAPGVPDGVWHHAAVTYDKTTGDGALFLDGLSVATGTKGAGLAAADPTETFTIGGNVTNGNTINRLTGAVADVVVYGGPLTTAEVLGLVDGLYPANPLAFFPTLEGMGTSAADLSGNGHTLTLAADGWVADGPYCAP